MIAPTAPRRPPPQLQPPAIETAAIEPPPAAFLSVMNSPSTLVVAAARVAFALVLSLAASASPAGPATQVSPKVSPGSSPEVTADAFARAADYSAEHAGRALLVMRDGKVLHERYDNGWTAQRPHPLASGTKSFSGILAAAAIQDGFIPDWDTKVVSDLPTWAGDPLKSQITLRHLLSLSSGLEPGDNVVGGRGGGRLLGAGAAQRAQRLERQGGPEPADLYAASLALPMAGKPGAQFRYGPSHFYSFGAYLEARLVAANAPQTTVDAYLKARIIEPLGITSMLIGRDKAGHPNLPGGMLLTARDWAKFGQFVLDRGAITLPDGTKKQLLREDLLAELFKPSAANPRYGLTWWLPSGDGSTEEADTGGNLNERLQRRSLDAQTAALKAPDGKPLTVYMAAGLGKQRLLVVPELDLVIVRFAEATAKGSDYSDAELARRLLAVP